MEEGQNIKRIIIISIIIIVVLTILVGILSFYFSNKQKNLEKQKAERAAKVKSNELLDILSKTDWTVVLGKECSADNKGLKANKFSWVNSVGSAELMDGHNLNIIFKNQASGECCGDVEKMQEKLKIFFTQNEFIENQININQENYIYAFENDGMKCLYGYRDVENKKNFCEMGIICGRVNKTFTDSYFQQIYNVFNTDKVSNMVVVDKLVENLNGKFVRGRIGYTFYLNAEKVFIAKQKEGGEWESLDKPQDEDRKIAKCKYLLDWKVPPLIADPTCKDKDEKNVEYLKVYSE